jgi:hypothetical protein
MGEHSARERGKDDAVPEVAMHTEDTDAMADDDSWKRMLLSSGFLISGN